MATKMTTMMIRMTAGTLDTIEMYREKNLLGSYQVATQLVTTNFVFLDFVPRL
jgi:hypothetical protein